MPEQLPSNFTILVGSDNTIREIANDHNAPYLKAYYCVEKKENISASKDVLVITEDGGFRQGSDARIFLGMALNGKATLAPSQIPSGARTFVESTSHNRKIKAGSTIVLKTSNVATTNTVPTTPTSSTPARRPAAGGDANPRPARQARGLETPAELSRRAVPAAAAPVPTVTPPRAGSNCNNNNSNNSVTAGGRDRALDSQVLSLRLAKAGAQSSDDLQVSLIWNDIADLDLACITPSGERIYYGSKQSQCGGWLDVDMNVNLSNASTEPVENIFWASAPSGKYKFMVTNFNCHTKQDSTFYNASRSVPFRCFLKRGDKVEVYDGSVKHKEVITCFDIEHEGNGALGSFVVMPPSTTKTTFKQACEANGVTYSQGNGYYAVCRKENISAKKFLILQHIESDTFTIGAEEVRRELQWAQNSALTVNPADLPAGTRLFVQSTSHNRLIPPGTHVLMKVSVDEALRHRPAHNTRFVSESHTMGVGPARENTTAIADTTGTTTATNNTCNTNENSVGIVEDHDEDGHDDIEDDYDEDDVAAGSTIPAQ